MTFQKWAASCDLETVKLDVDIVQLPPIMLLEEGVLTMFGQTKLIG